MPDSRKATQDHIDRVGEFIAEIISQLIKRIPAHDKSKLEEPEKEIFDIYSVKLKDLVFGSEEYNESLREMKPALDHHYANNRHHPDCFKNGICGMNLVDIIEMICDWKASCLRHNNGNIVESISINQKRFNYSDELKQIFLNTIEFLESKNEKE